MTPLSKARDMADLSIGTYCDFCAGSPISGHFEGCPILAMPKIVRVLELMGQGIQALGEHPVQDEDGLARGMFDSLRDVCLWCGVSSYGRNQHYDGCEWEELVNLFKGDDA